MREASARGLPSADRILRSEPVQELQTRYARMAVVALVRGVLHDARQGALCGSPVPDHEEIIRTVVDRAMTEWVPAPQRVINATGVILHTNLGRAVLSAEAMSAVSDAAGYSDLEYDLRSGSRASRLWTTSRMLKIITGTESAHVATNGASAMTLALATLAKGKEVIVSRGQAVEIGGGFRVPVVLKQSGAKLVEVGTTNRTRISDYEGAVTSRTAAILHVHTSNFRIIGFTQTVALPELAEFAHNRDLLLLDDNGSGALLDTASFGLAHEPTPIESLQAGSDVVAFSADKLLGGPQAGLLLARSSIVERMSKHPLARAFRLDKMSIAALNATLLAYIRGDADRTLPIWRMIGQTAEDVQQRAAVWQDRASQFGLIAEIRSDQSTVGGGSLPGETLPTTVLVLPHPVTADKLRSAAVPIICRVSENRVVLDPRTVSSSDEDDLFESLRSIWLRA